MSAAPFYGRPFFENEAAAIAVLYEWTGQQFGNDAVAWGEWLRKNRAVYNRHLDRGHWATVTQVGHCEWQVKTDDGRLLPSRITALVHTTKIPTLQVGDRVKVEIALHRNDLCSILLSSSPVVWIAQPR